jgi:hypothetical protein
MERAIVVNRSQSHALSLDTIAVWSARSAWKKGVTDFNYRSLFVMANIEDGLFPVLTRILKEAGTPLDCTQLFDFPEVKAVAASPNRVSDYLGGMWRKGQVVRHVTPRTENSRARYSYEWKHDGKKPVSTLTSGSPGIEYAPRILADRPSMVISEEGNTITIELPHLIISIRSK